MASPRVLAFAGSTRENSFNKKLIQVAAVGARESGAEVTVIDLRDFPMPIYDGDIEENQGLPENAIKLKDLFLSHQGLMMACPEYNSSITGVWKNTIDWVSRPRDGEERLACFANKVAVIMSTSPGALGGLRGLTHVRSILSNIKVTVLPEQVAVSKAAEAFAEDGTMTDAKQQQSVHHLGQRLTYVLQKLQG